MRARPFFAFSLLLTAAAVPALAAAPAARTASPENPPKPVAIRCYPPQGESIPAQKILHDLFSGKDVDLQGRIIEGSLDADLAWPAADEPVTSLRIIAGRLRCNS